MPTHLSGQIRFRHAGRQCRRPVVVVVRMLGCCKNRLRSGRCAGVPPPHRRYLTAGGEWGFILLTPREVVDVVVVTCRCGGALVGGV